MSTANEIYNTAITKSFVDQGFDVIYKPSCLEMPYNGRCWPISYPNVTTWNDNTMVVMHCQDFVSIDSNGDCPELIRMEKHYGKHANQVSVIHWNFGLEKNYTGPLNLCYFATHSFELIQQLRRIESQWLDMFDNERTQVWQCLNGFPKPHRRLVVNSLLANVNNGVVSLGTDIPLESANYSEYKECDNVSNWLALRHLYGSTQINVVNETMYYEKPGIISEKTLMAFIGKQVPIVIGYHGIVEDCRQLGFDMFDDIVDTSYDTAPNAGRWHIAVDANLSLLRNGITVDISQRLENNYQRALSLPEWQLSYLTDRVARIVQEKIQYQDIV